MTSNINEMLTDINLRTKINPCVKKHTYV